tara:strand:+ start:30 stop:206 length:177 start_codon:yes stop_codon:yes gene_type:complete
MIKVKPNKNYHSLGTNIRLDKNKVYIGEIATNQPNYKKLGLMFVGEILLNKNEYKIIK